MTRWLPLVLTAGSILSAGAFALFVHGLSRYPDFWDVSLFASLFYAGLAASMAATAAAVKMWRAARAAERKDASWIPLQAVAVLLLVIHAVGFVVMQSQPVRGAWHAFARHIVLTGMARDLPGPPKPDEQKAN